MIDLTYQSDEQMVQYEVDSNKRRQCLASSYHSLIHYFYPGFLSQNLEHRHKCLKYAT